MDDGIPQSSYIFGALLIAFIVFITLRGELDGYLSVLFKRSGSADPAPPAPPAAPQNSGGGASFDPFGLLSGIGGLFGGGGSGGDPTGTSTSTISFG